VHVRTFGNSANPPLFFLHGSYTDSRPYRNICESLSDKYYIVVWDQRGCGLSERITADEFTLESAVEEINSIKAIYSPNKKVTIIGHSWGGGLGTLYTSKNPENVNQLVVIEPMPLKDEDMQLVYKKIVDFSYADGSWNSTARNSQALSPKGHNELDYKAMMMLRGTLTANYFCDKNNITEWPIRRVGGFIELTRNNRLGKLVGTNYTFSYSFIEGIQSFQDTVLILGGSCSSIGYDFQKQYSFPRFKAAKIVEIQNAGHRMNFEQFDAVMTAIKSYLIEY
jgi:proline iminopeptidase